MLARARTHLYPETRAFAVAPAFISEQEWRCQTSSKGNARKPPRPLLSLLPHTSSSSLAVHAPPRSSPPRSCSPPPGRSPTARPQHTPQNCACAHGRRRWVKREGRLCGRGCRAERLCGVLMRLRTSLWKSGTAQPHLASCFSSSPSRIFSKRSYISLCWHGCAESAESASRFSCNPQLARSTRNARRRTTQTKASYRQRVLARTQRLSEER